MSSLEIDTVTLSTIYPPNAINTTKSLEHHVLLATAEFAVNIMRLINGFLRVGPSYPTGVEGFFSDVTEKTFIVKGALYNVQTLILDAAVIYRWTALLDKFSPSTCTVGLNRAFITASVNTDDVFAEQTGRWITATYAMTLTTNLIATTLLAYRIWRVNRRTSEFVASKCLTPILLVVIESGAIYSMTIVAALVAFALNSVGVYVILDLISPIISIVFNMIIVRIGLASDRGLSAVGFSNNSVPSGGVHQEGGTGSFKTVTVNVELSQFQYYDGDESSLAGSRAAAVEEEQKKAKENVVVGVLRTEEFAISQERR
ncbi:hypothetical protein EIP91_009631 [Steccherinum ochraceum]|uniref:Uncharacterized protein n=1 Tax=Steccherinum ochraceum TaxID=92696 RepID=A0A4R0R6V5_9APHY|nr:hypothetical protein EIP91_009631 [Steccherinum ochraceum]